MFINLSNFSASSNTALSRKAKTISMKVPMKPEKRATPNPKMMTQKILSIEFLGDISPNPMVDKDVKA